MSLLSPWTTRLSSFDTPKMINITSKPYDEEYLALAAPMNPTFLKAILVTRDTAIFGLCLAFVYGGSYLLLTTIIKFWDTSRNKREAMQIFAPILLAAPFWGSVFLTSTDLLPLIHLPFLESIFWSLVAWSVIISAFTIISILLCIALGRPGNADILSLARHDCTIDVVALKDAEEGVALISSPHAALETPSSLPPSPTEPARPRIGSVTRCWSDATSAHGSITV